MSSRTIQVGDIAQVTVQGQNYIFPIDRIDSQGIHVSSYVIVPQGNIWQVQDYVLPHTISFFLAVTVPTPVPPVPTSVPSVPPPIPSVPTPVSTPVSTPVPPSYAVYYRTGPRKILMVLKPRTREVTYSPFGVQSLGLNINKLPPYELATNLVARGQFVLLPYVKGRPEQEIEQLITEQPPQAEYEIRDITPGPIYTGVYGRLSPVGRSLRPVTPCQKTHHFALGQSSRGSPFYTAMIQIAILNVLDPGKLMLGENEEYLITSDIDFNEILDDISKCGRIYYLIGVSKDKNLLTLKKAGVEDTAHAMAIVIDPQEKLLEVFDPNGLTPDTRHVYFWTNQLVNFLREHGIEVYRKITADEPFCPQMVTAFAPEWRGEQQCLVWAFWYIWLRMNNPTVPAEAIRRYMAKMSPSEAFDKVRRIASIAFGS